MSSHRDLSQGLKRFLCIILAKAQAYLLTSVTFFSVHDWRGKWHGLINTLCNCLTHLSTSDLNTDHVSIPTNCPIVAWNGLFHPQSDDLPFRTDAPNFPLSCIRAMPYSSNKTFLANYHPTCSNEIIHTAQWTGVPTVAPTLLYFRRTICTHTSFRSYFISLMPLSASHSSFRIRSPGISPLF